jgi:hypothetical protein
MRDLQYSTCKQFYFTACTDRAITDSNPKIVPKTVRFDDVPVFIKSNLDIWIDEYDIIRDIKDQKANVMIGQLLHDNTNNQKLIREAWTRRRKKKFKLPSVAVNFSQPEDSGAPEATIEVEGCSIPKYQWMEDLESTLCWKKRHLT